MDTVKDHVREGKQHSIYRSSIIRDVLALHGTEAACSEYPFQVKFMDEPGLDFGGVTRDMYCAFWASAYESHRVRVRVRVNPLQLWRWWLHITMIITGALMVVYIIILYDIVEAHCYGFR